VGDQLAAVSQQGVAEDEQLGEQLLGSGVIGRFAPFGGELHRGSWIVMPAQQR